MATLYCFGHVHASAGIVVEASTTYANASLVDRSYRVVRRPWILDLRWGTARLCSLSGIPGTLGATGRELPSVLQGRLS